MTPQKQTTFENIVAKGEIAHEEQFPNLAIVFSTLFNISSFNNREFQYLWGKIKFVCCRYTVHGKGLKQV